MESRKAPELLGDLTFWEIKLTGGEGLGFRQRLWNRSSGKETCQRLGRSATPQGQCSGMTPERCDSGVPGAVYIQA
jgi:hypothetical protein